MLAVAAMRVAIPTRNPRQNRSHVPAGASRHACICTMALSRAYRLMSPSREKQSLFVAASAAADRCYRTNAVALGLRARASPIAGVRPGVSDEPRKSPGGGAAAGLVG